jgi:hypothetical protein
MPTALTSLIAGLVSGIEPADDLAREHRRAALVRWWTVGELRHADPDRFEPHLLRALNALGIGR